MTKKADDRYVDPDEWVKLAPGNEGSWWPEWVAWLAERSGDSVAPPSIGAPDSGYKPLCNAPGAYVLRE